MICRPEYVHWMICQRMMKWMMMTVGVIMYSVRGRCIAECHEKAISKIIGSGVRVVVSDNEMIELDEPLSIYVAQPMSLPQLHHSLPYTQRYIDEYIKQVTTSTTNDFSYTYGNRLRNYDGIDQLQQCYIILKNDLKSRRAIMHTWQVQHDLGNVHVPCMQTIQFQIRHDQLNCITTFRSNDILLAWGCNAIAIVELMKELARMLGIAVGHLETISTNAHVYVERDGDVLRKMLRDYTF